MKANQAPQLLLVCVGTSLAFSSEGWSQTIWYVNGNLATGNDDGSSWANAFRTTVEGRTALQRAIDVAEEGDEIWVAAGTYRPAVSDRSDSFYLKTGVKIYGGFTGATCETQLCQRDFKHNITILSGDLGANDASPPSFSTYGENSCTVIRVISQNPDLDATRLDGFTIIGGNSSAGCTTVIPGCQGILDSNGGGAIRFECSGKGTIANCVITFNRADHDGGGVFAPYFSLMEARFVNCSISRNYAHGAGGGIGATKSLQLLEVYNSKIIGNQADHNYGGGVALSGGGVIRIVNTVIAHNLRTGSDAGVSGGGIATYGGGILFVVNSTIAFNDAGTARGGGIAVHGGINNIDNSIIWGNMGSVGRQIYKTGTGGTVLNIRHVDYVADPRNSPGQEVFVLGNPIVFGAGNLNVDPLFVNPVGADADPLSWEDNDYSVLNTPPNNVSPVLDTANNGFVEPDRPDLNRNGNVTEPVPFDLGARLRFFPSPTQ